MTNGDSFPEEIEMQGVDFALRAVKRGYDKHGTMRYRMMYGHGAPITIVSTQMNRGSMGLVFETPHGRVAFDFAFKEEEVS